MRIHKVSNSTLSDFAINLKNLENEVIVIDGVSFVTHSIYESCRTMPIASCKDVDSLDLEIKSVVMIHMIK